MTTEAEYKRILDQIKIAFPWMLEDIKHRADIIKPGDYSPELQHAISCGELLETMG